MGFFMKKTIFSLLLILFSLGSLPVMGVQYKASIELAKGENVGWLYGLRNAIKKIIMVKMRTPKGDTLEKLGITIIKNMDTGKLHHKLSASETESYINYTSLDPNNINPNHHLINNNMRLTESEHGFRFSEKYRRQIKQREEKYILIVKALIKLIQEIEEKEYKTLVQNQDKSSHITLEKTISITTKSETLERMKERRRKWAKETKENEKERIVDLRTMPEIDMPKIENKEFETKIKKIDLLKIWN